MSHPPGDDDASRVLIGGAFILNHLCGGILPRAVTSLCSIKYPISTNNNTLRPWKTMLETRKMSRLLFLSVGSFVLALKGKALTHQRCERGANRLLIGN